MPQLQTGNFREEKQCGAAQCVVHIGTVAAQWALTWNQCHCSMHWLLEHLECPVGISGGKFPVWKHKQRFLYRVPIVATAGGRFTTNAAGFMTR